jgi:hypothetical protein
VRVVLLKNDGILPLASDTTARIAVIGGHAQLGWPVGFGSSAVVPPGGYATRSAIGGPGPMGALRNVNLLPSAPLDELRKLLPGAQNVDGPHGVFSIDQDEGPGFGFIAGGVGVTGPLSILRTMADRDDVRPAVLIYANGDWEGVAYRDELERLERRMNLTVVHVLQRPPANWTGETGYVTAELLARHLPRGHRRFQFFICGPGPMMDAAESALVELGVPTERVHTERFDMV